DADARAGVARELRDAPRERIVGRNDVEVGGNGNTPREKKENDAEKERKTGEESSIPRRIPFSDSRTTGSRGEERPERAKRVAEAGRRRRELLTSEPRDPPIPVRSNMTHRRYERRAALRRPRPFPRPDRRGDDLRQQPRRLGAHLLAVRPRRVARLDADRSRLS